MGAITNRNAFAGKVAIITGAGSGIGRALAVELARRGARVVVGDIDEARIDEVLDKLKDMGADVAAYVLDVADYDAVKKMVNETVTAYGRIDYMFNNAGIGVVGHVRDLSLQDWRRVIDVNLFGVIHGSYAVYPIMLRQGSGHILNVASGGGLIPAIGFLPYTTSKYAIVGMTKGLRMEAEPHGVKVSVVCPGYIDTAIFKDSKLINLDGKIALSGLKGKKLTSARKCAKDILRGALRNEEVIVVSDEAKFAWFMERAAPEVVRFFLKREYKDVLAARIDGPDEGGRRRNTA